MILAELTVLIEDDVGTACVREAEHHRNHVKDCEDAS